MIKSVNGGKTRRFIDTGKSKFSGLDRTLAFARLNQIEGATALTDFGLVQSIGLHKLTGDRKGFWSVKVNGPWRIIFRFQDGDAFDVEIVDYH